MNWYVAEVLLQSAIEPKGTGYSPLIERSYFLVSADDETSANERAITAARSKQHSYTNAEGETVRWDFLKLERVREVMDKSLRDGTEV